jgi:hypothetical protein
MYLPVLKTAHTHARYKLGPYVALVLTDCQSAGVIQYRYVVVVLKPGDSQPCFAVTAESSEAIQPQPGTRGYFLGVFPGSGHLNMGLSEDWGDLEKFTAKALDIIAAHLNVSDAPVKLMDTFNRSN